jgi:hypothetical protein
MTIEDSSFLGRDRTSLDEWFPAFFLRSWLYMSRYINPNTRRHIPKYTVTATTASKLATTIRTDGGAEQQSSAPCLSCNVPQLAQSSEPTPTKGTKLKRL